MNKHTQTSGRPASGMRVARVVTVLIAGLTLTACGLFDSGGSSGPACQENNTGDVSFRNTTGGSGANMYVHWDGIDITGTLVDGATSTVTTVSAIPHYLVFRFSGGVTVACTGSYVTPGQCGSTVYSCGG